MDPLVLSSPVAPSAEQEEEEVVDEVWLEVLRGRRRNVEARAQLLREGGVDRRGDWELVRVAATELSMAGCRERFVRPGRMALITGLEGLCPCNGMPDTWSFLGEMFGTKTVAVHTSATRNEGHDFRTGGSMVLMPLGELLTRLRQGMAQGMYLYDCPLPDKLPQLLEMWAVPRYFSHCYLQQTRLPHGNKRSWPTLFIGAAGTGSPMHIDRWQGHFWMLVLEGTKKWTVWAPEDLPLLSPCFTNKYDPSFPLWEELASRPDTGLAHSQQLEVGPGELIFVPGGAPHLVENLTDTIAIGGNFVDESNFERVMAELRILAHRYPDARQLADALDEMDFDENAAMHEQTLDIGDLGVMYDALSSGSAHLWKPP